MILELIIVVILAQFFTVIVRRYVYPALPHQRKVALTLPTDPVNTYRLEHEIYTDIYDDDYVLAMHHGKDDCPFCPQILEQRKTRFGRTPLQRAMRLENKRKQLKSAAKTANEMRVQEMPQRWDTAYRPDVSINHSLNTLEVKRPSDVPSGADAEVIYGDGQVVNVVWTWYDVSTGRQFKYAQPLVGPATHITKNTGFA